jgi:two-component system response regulator HydG
MDEQELNRYTKEIINTMNDGVVLVSPDGIILMVNRALEEISGYTRDDLLGRPCSIFHCDVCEVARSEGGGHWCELFEVGHAHRRSCMLMRKDRSYVHVLKNAALLKAADGRVLGAVETITDISEIDKRDQKIQQLARLLDGDADFHGMVGRSTALRKVFEIVQKAAQSDAPVIIFGETGTGKELVAHAIHSLGKRHEGPYIQLNCAALNEALLESELFGHVKGAFTGAYSHREGRFEAANAGDIFLDEIGDVPLSIQVKLLRFLETKQFERVGDHQPIKTDVRIITATNKHLDRLVSQGKFREDLFFRINIIPIHLPPLRDRLEDLPLLTEHFVRQLQARSGKNLTGLTAEAMELFMSHRWPGNIRELRGVLEYAFVIAESGLIHPEHLPAQMTHPAAREKAPHQTPASPPADEKMALIEALIQCRGNQSGAARMLGLNRVTVWHRIKKYGIDLQELLER